MALFSFYIILIPILGASVPLLLNLRQYFAINTSPNSHDIFLLFSSYLLLNTLHQTDRLPVCLPCKVSVDPLCTGRQSNLSDSMSSPDTRKRYKTEWMPNKPVFCFYHIQWEHVMTPVREIRVDIFNFVIRNSKKKKKSLEKRRWKIKVIK